MWCINENLDKSLFGDSKICAAVAIQQQNFSFNSEDKFFHQLQVTGGLTRKEKYCNIMGVCSCSAVMMWHCEK
jgi:hypothetical protein